MYLVRRYLIEENMSVYERGSMYIHTYHFLVLVLLGLRGDRRLVHRMRDQIPPNRSSG
jgi:hypothetical protein